MNTSKPARRENRLGREKSPYLLQHRHNPVDWYSWGDEAFAKAREQDKPVFLSIGYSTCHWCHVMERESFESDEVAALLNDMFVSIKVDREERPDVDAIYMSAAVAMTGSGGWPLSAFLDHERVPFFAGTYFPPEDAHGRPGFKTLLQRLHRMWKEDRQRLIEGGRELREHIARSGDKEAKAPLKEEYLDRILNGFRSQHDGELGGFGGAPKFPRTAALEFLMRVHARKPDSEALPMVRRQLDAMMDGGIYDRIGGGFHRYSTDERWLVPHFEKMLYDNALIPRAYLQAWQATGDPRYVRVIRETCEYVLRDMTSPTGGFFSAEDADSEGFEGTFYLWTPAKLKAVVPGRDGDLLCRAFGVVEGGNWVPHEPREPRGNSVVHRAATSAELASEFKIGEAEADRILEEGRRRLFEARSKRVRPHLDDKVLVEWNGMMIGTLAAAGAALEEPRYLAAAEKAADFILAELRRADGRLLRRFRDGEASIPAFLDDYAAFIEGLIELYQATFKAERLHEAVALARSMLELFGDPKGGFFMTGSDGEALIARTRETYDGAVPSGNAVAAHVLLRLGEYTGDESFSKAARATVERSGRDLAMYGTAYPHLASAMEAILSPWREVVIAGDAPELWKTVRSRHLPNTIVMAVPSGGAGPELMKRYPVLEGRVALNGKPTAYVCRNRVCAAPVSSVEDLVRLLDGK